MLRDVDRVNHWDLVDLAGPKLIGPRLRGRPKRMALLEEFAASEDLWKRRIAIMSTFPFVRDGDFGPTLRLARRLLDDDHDLIHKAAGWMLREVGNRDRAALLRCLDRHARRMPRTMLRYALEKLPPTQRRRYLSSPGRRQGMQERSRPLEKALSWRADPTSTGSTDAL